MQHSITIEGEHLKARLFSRETAEEMLEFVRAVVAENEKLQLAAILIDIHASRPIFHFANEFLDELGKLSSDPSCRIALIGDAIELRLSNDYLALLAGQRGWNVRSFHTEGAALQWLSERRGEQERRRRFERREPRAQRDEAPPRRSQQRRFSRDSARTLH